jgi:hypothetical protein
VRCLAFATVANFSTVVNFASVICRESDWHCGMSTVGHVEISAVKWTITSK